MITFLLILGRSLPASSLVNLYLQFFTFFLAEELFGTKRHLGVSDEEAVDQSVRLHTRSRKDRASKP